MKSEDPYAVDVRFLQELFSQFGLAECPRETIDPLAVFKNNSSYSITTGSQGQATVVLNPYGMANGFRAGSSTSSLYPFISLSSSNSNLVYNGSTQVDGPFYTQIANVEGVLPDMLKVSFMCTQSALQAQGKVTASVYYSYPNQSLTPQVTNTYDGTVAAITAAEQLNLLQGTKVYNVPEAINRYSQIARWIPTANDFSMDLLNPAQYANGSTIANTVAFIVLNF